MSRVMPPVWRSRWKRSDSACRCLNTAMLMRRIARCVTLAKMTSRKSAKVVLAKRNTP